MTILIPTFHDLFPGLSGGAYVPLPVGWPGVRLAPLTGDTGPPGYATSKQRIADTGEGWTPARPDQFVTARPNAGREEGQMRDSRERPATTEHRHHGNH